MPIEVVSTEPVTTILAVKSPSTASVAVAPASLKRASTSKVMMASPDKLITGPIVSATITLRVTAVAALPAASLTL